MMRISVALAAILPVSVLTGACTMAPDGFLARGLAGHYYLHGARRNLYDNPAGAFAAWTRAADAGHAKATYQLAHLYGSDALGPRDQEEALALARKAAADGYAPAAHYVGMSLLYGWGGMDKDPAAAEPFLRRAVAADIGRARADLGWLLLDRAADAPAGTAASARDEGLALLEEAVADDDPVGKFRLGEVLMEGRHIPRNPARAADLLEEAVDAGEDRAALPLARMRLLGDGIPVDRQGALALLDRVESKAPAHVLVTLARALLDTDDALPHDPRRARRLLERAAEAGRTTAHTTLGKLLADGAPGVPPDPTLAVHHLRVAAEAGNGEATRYMGHLLEDQGRADDALDWFLEAAARGHGHAAVEAARLLLKRADAGSARRALAILGEVAPDHTSAALELARLARDGQDGILPADPAIARHWFQHVRATGARKAAAQATNDLARMVLRGEGGPTDPETAHALFREAAAAGHGWAALELGRLFEDGAAPIPADPAQAWHWYREAAARGVAQGHTALGRLLARDGQGADAVQAAFAHFRKAAEGGHDWALYEAGKAAEQGVAGQPGDPATAWAWYQRAAAQGVDAAFGAMGSLHERGLGLPRDDTQALALYHLGARAGNAWATYKVGAFVAEGRGTPADPDAARAWLDLAANRGVEEATEMRARLERGEVGPFGAPSGSDGPGLRIQVSPTAPRP